MAGARHTADGHLWLSDKFGQTLQIDPLIWQDGPALVGRLLGLIDRDLVVELPARSPDEIPEVFTTSQLNRKARALLWRIAGNDDARVVLIVLSSLVIVIAVVLIVGVALLVGRLHVGLAATTSTTIVVIAITFIARIRRHYQAGDFSD